MKCKCEKQTVEKKRKTERLGQLVIRLVIASTWPKARGRAQCRVYGRGLLCIEYIGEVIQ